MDKHLKPGGTNDSVMGSITLLNRRLVTSNVPRMLTPSEVALLRKSKQEIAERYRMSN